MNSRWDNGEVAHDPKFWTEVYRVLKPGAHLVAFAGTRTYHRMVCAIEDAGFEIRDQIGWAYATGFPKSHDVARSIDKAARGVPHGGADPTSPNHGKFKSQGSEGKRHDGDSGQGFGAGPGQFMREAGTRVGRELVPEAHVWTGWGTALKPAWEPIVLARKPLSEPTVAANVLCWGTGALNIDGCRIHADDAQGGEYTVKRLKPGATLNKTGGNWRPDAGDGVEFHGTMRPGRWPANFCHDSSPEVVALLPESGGQQGDIRGTEPSALTDAIYGERQRVPFKVPFNKCGGEASAERRYAAEGSTDFAAMPGERRSDAGSAARFFFSAKADKDDRFGSRHPTVKPIDLIRWLARLVTPPGGTILDPFAGSGTLGVAALAEGFDAILVEREDAYVADIHARLDHYRGAGRHSLAVKNRSRTAKPAADDLFSATAPTKDAAD